MNQYASISNDSTIGEEYYFIIILNHIISNNSTHIFYTVVKARLDEIVIKKDSIRYVTYEYDRGVTEDYIDSTINGITNKLTILVKNRYKL